VLQTRTNYLLATGYVNPSEVKTMDPFKVEVLSHFFYPGRYGAQQVEQAHSAGIVVSS